MEVLGLTGLSSRLFSVPLSDGKIFQFFTNSVFTAILFVFLQCDEEMKEKKQAW